jgi:hypothetical protein
MEKLRKGFMPYPPFLLKNNKTYELGLVLLSTVMGFD